MVDTFRVTDAGAFVGREAELGQVRRLLSRAQAGTRSIALFDGMPGIGKSALLHRAAELAAQQGFDVAWGRCWEAGGAPAYWPWSQVLSTVFARDGSEVSPELNSQLASILPDQATDGEATADGDPAAARFRLFTAVAGALRAASNTRPLLILLDDIHLADEPSLLLLRFISSDREQGRVALMGAFRNPDNEAAPEWRPPAILLELARQPQVETIHVGGLDATNVADFILATTGRDAEQNLVHQVHEETEGNPLVMGEIVRLLEY
ncbi:MAG TPA: ATP-binding protein, partial [Dehalococcoidia bacterium]|nr:ATP-binding protein [Dehalococcoidia bacterium]